MTDFAASSHPGLKRDHNEDQYRADERLGLWLVADGIGGHSDGEVASAIVAETIHGRVAEGSSLLDAILDSHEEVLDEIHRRQGCNMGSTVVACLVCGDDYEIGWVGDSRAYLFDGELRQLTRDHNPVVELLAEGAITAEEAAIDPQRHVLSQSLGVSELAHVDPGTVSGKLGPGQQLLLCSDGLTDELNDADIAIQLRAHSTTREQVNALVDGALKAGGRDNVTVVVVGAPSTGDAAGAASL